MIRKFISQVDGAEFQYRFNGINLELKSDGCDWSDFIPEGILEDEKELGTPVKEQQQLYEVILKLKSKLEEVQTTMEEENITNFANGEAI